MSGEVRSFVPDACTLMLGVGVARVAAWCEFNDDYLLDVDLADGVITTHYPKIDDAVNRLTDLVSAERECCGNVAWVIDRTHHDLRLVVTGREDALAALTFLRETPVRDGGEKR